MIKVGAGVVETPNRHMSFSWSDYPTRKKIRLGVKISPGVPTAPRANFLAPVEDSPDLRRHRRSNNPHARRHMQSWSCLSQSGNLASYLRGHSHLRLPPVRWTVNNRIRSLITQIIRSLRPRKRGRRELYLLMNDRRRSWQQEHWYPPQGHV